jgi:hypothetical protein
MTFNAILVITYVGRFTGHRKGKAKHSKRNGQALNETVNIK